MKITLIGTGNMGAGFVKQLTKAGHQVRVTGRDLSKARALANAHPGATAVAVEDAVSDSEVVILATGYADAVSALQSAGQSIRGRVIVDITNPLTPDYMGLTLGHSTSAAEQIAAAVPGAYVVKAFNTILAQVLAEGAEFGGGNVASVFYAGDNEHAKQVVHSVAESMGFTAIDSGPLKNARYLEPMGGLNVYFAYGAGHGTAIAPIWIKRT